MSTFSLSSIPDLSGKVILITGGNTGLGKEAALQLAKHKPAHVFVTSRSKESARLAISEIEAAAPGVVLTPIQMDLASFASVEAAAKDVLAQTSRLDILMNNAGIMAVPVAVTTDGYEIQFGTNHMGHALLTKLLLPTLLKTAQQPGSDVRIVNLSSHSHERANAIPGGINFDALCSADPATNALANYGQSKLANILHAKELAKRYPSIKAVSIHPGMVNTGLTNTMKKSFLLARIAMPVVAWRYGVAVEQGVVNQLWGATADVKSGEYYEPIGVSGKGTPFTEDTKLAEKLWEWTEGELASKGFGAGAKL